SLRRAALQTCGERRAARGGANGLNRGKKYRNRIKPVRCCGERWLKARGPARRTGSCLSQPCADLDWWKVVDECNRDISPSTFASMTCPLVSGRVWQSLPTSFLDTASWRCLWPKPEPAGEGYNE